jgi:hypothetical protein
MPGDALRVLSLDRGIQEIMESPGEEDVRLPGDFSPIVPGEERPESRLDRMFREPSLDGRLLGSLKPDIRERDVLIPDRFRRALGEAAREMKELLEREDGRNGWKSLNDALALLEEHEALMDLLSTYRNLLHKG